MGRSEASIPLLALLALVGFSAFMLWSRPKPVELGTSLWTLYPKAHAFMHSQPEYAKRQVEYQSIQFNLWLQRICLEDRVVPGEQANRGLRLMEDQLATSTKRCEA